MGYKFNLIPIIGAVMVASLVAGCQSSPNQSASSSNPNPTATDVASTNNTDRASDLNLTADQKAKIKQIREQNQAKIVALLSSDQQTKFKTATADNHEPPYKALRELNLSPDQKKQVGEIIRTQRQQTDAILTPEQKAKIKQHRGDQQQP